MLKYEYSDILYMILSEIVMNKPMEKIYISGYTMGNSNNFNS